MKPHPEVLSRVQQKLLRRLGPIATARGFYLGGGTALALWLGHRRSVDLDWITDKRLSDPLRLAEDIRDADIPFVTAQVEKGTLRGMASGVEVSWFQYRYPELEPREKARAFDCELASLHDLAAMKLAAVSQRGAKKDFVDLYALCQHGFSLAQMLGWYRQKFGLNDLGHLLYSLSYFGDADRERMPKLLHPMNWRAIKKTIRKWVRETARGD